MAQSRWNSADAVVGDQQEGCDGLFRPSRWACVAVAIWRGLAGWQPFITYHICHFKAPQAPRPVSIPPRTFCSTVHLRADPPPCTTCRSNRNLAWFPSPRWALRWSRGSLGCGWELLPISALISALLTRAMDRIDCPRIVDSRPARYFNDASIGRWQSWLLSVLRSIHLQA